MEPESVVRPQMDSILTKGTLTGITHHRYDQGVGSMLYNCSYSDDLVLVGFHKIKVLVYSSVRQLGYIQNSAHFLQIRTTDRDVRAGGDHTVGLDATSAGQGVQGNHAYGFSDVNFTFALKSSKFKCN